MTEPGFGLAARQAAQLFRRARAYPLSVLVTALLLAASVVGLEWLGEHAFGPRFVLRAVEADRDARTAPRPKRQLREYVMGAVFSNAALRAVMDEHGLYPSLSRNNPQAALESFREDIQVEVYRNYFVEERSAHDAPRSARIAVSYRSEQRELALAVTRELGDLIVKHEQRSRREQAERAAKRAGVEVKRARARYLSHKKKINEIAWFEAETEPERQLARVQLAGLRRTLQSLERDLEVAEQRQAALELGEHLEQQRLGMTFEVVDRAAIPRSAELEPRELVELGLLTFVLGLPLAAMAVGAFSRSVVNAEDLAQLGIPLLGQVPRLRTEKIRRGA